MSDSRNPVSISQHLALAASSATLVVALMATAAAQDSPGQYSPASMPSLVGALPGRIVGTQRYLVSFRTRSYDLSEFAAARRGRQPASVVDPIVARYRAATKRDQAGFVAEIESMGGRVFHQYWLNNGCAIEVPPAVAQAVRAMPNVWRVEPDLQTEPHIRQSTGSANHNSDAVNAVGLEGAGATLAIMDTGQDEAVGALSRPHRLYFVNGNPTGTNRLLINRKIGTQPADDVNGHGTAVASVAVGGGWQSFAADKGHAPRAGIAGYAIANATNGFSSLTTMTNAWNQIAADAATYKIVAVNCSYSGHTNPLSASQQALDACALHADILVCVSGGNQGNTTAGSQACANGLAVAASVRGSHAVASFSSKGPLIGDYNRYYPDITANGVATVMAKRDNETANHISDGTSFASPQVAGAATLLRAYEPSMPAVETKAILLAGARDIAANNPSLTRQAYGAGLLRDDWAYKITRSSAHHGTGLSSARGPQFYRNFTLQAGRAYNFSIAWMREDLTTMSWANLDLEIRRGATVVASSTTTRNLYEFVRYTPTSSGVYTMWVKTVSYEPGKQAQGFGWATNVPLHGLVGTYVSYARGCRGSTTAGGSGKVPALSSRGAPGLGQQLAITLDKARPQARAVLFLGGSRQQWNGLPLPFDLGALGATGCNLVAAGHIQLGAQADSAGHAEAALRIPDDVKLRGVGFYSQWLVFDPANPIGVVVSNGARAIVGD